MEDKYTKTYKCPFCTRKSNPMPKNLGDVIWKCKGCGTYLKHSFRSGKVEQIEMPKKFVSSGSVFC